MRRPSPVNALDRLRAVVQQHGTQRKAAKSLGVSEQYLSDILREARAVPVRVLTQLGLVRTIQERGR